MKAKLIVLFILQGLLTTLLVTSNILDGNTFITLGVIVFLSLLAYLLCFKIIINTLKKFNMTLADISNGNVVKKLDAEEGDALGEIAISTNKILDNIKRLIGDVIASSQKTIIYSENLRDHADISNKASQEISLAITEIASGVTEQFDYLTKIKTNTSNMIESSTIISNESTKALESSMDMEKIIDSNQITIENLINKMKDTSKNGINKTKSIKKLENEVSEINNIISTVTNISTQTNLLALNASIEAARAGEAGKGFTVVADEVKKLASQSASSTQEISLIIKKISSSILSFVKELEEENIELENNIGLADSAKESFNEILSSSKNTLNAVKSIHSKTGEGVNNATRIDGFIDEILKIIEQSAANSEETSASSQEQSASMEEIFNSINNLREMTREVSNKAENYLNQYKFDENTKGIIDDSLSILKELSTLPEISTMSWNTISPILVENMKKHQMFDFLGVMNNTGIFKGSNDEDLKGEDFSHRVYFKESIKGNEYITKPYITHPYYNFAVSVSYPIKVNGIIIGVIMGDVKIG